MDIAEILEKLGLSDIQSTGEDGNTALHLAVESETLTETEVIEILEISIENGIDPNTKDKKYEVTVLQLAVAYSMKDTIEFLLTHKANMNSTARYFILYESSRFKKISTQISSADENFSELLNIENESASYVEWLITKGFDFDSEDDRNQSAIHLAFERNLQHVLPVLCKYTKNLSFIDWRCRTLLHFFLDNNIVSEFDDDRICKNFYSQRYAVDIVKILLERGISINTEACFLEEEYVYRITPIITAINKQQAIRIIEILLNLYTNIHHKHFDGIDNETLLQTAINSSLYSTGEDTKYYLKIFSLITAKGADISEINKPNKYGRTPLISAVEKCKIDIIKFLQENGAIFKVTTKYGKNLLHLLAEKSSSSMIAEDVKITLFNLLINEGCQVNAKDQSESAPLHEAVRHENIPIIQKLVEHGAEVNCKTNHGTTPLQLAIYRRNLRAVEILGNNAADFSVFDEKGNNLLHLLAQTFADFHVSDAEAIFNLLVDKGCEVTAKNHNGETPLHLAVENDNFMIVQKLIDHGVEVNLKTNNGMTPILKAVDKKYNLRMVELLLKNGADAGVMTKNNENLLHLLAKDSKLDTTDDVLTSHFNLLISKNSQVNAKDKNGYTPIFLAAIESCNVRILELLKENGADLNLTSKDGENLLQLFLKSTNYKNLIEEEQIKLFRLIMNEGYEINTKDRNGNSLIDLAAAQATVKIVQILIELGANVNCRNNQQETPLHLALENNEVVGVVDLLLEHGANVDATNSMGLTALHIIAKDSGPGKRALWILLIHGANINVVNLEKQTVLHCARLRDYFAYKEHCYRNTDFSEYYDNNDDDYYRDGEDEEDIEYASAEVVFFAKHSIKLMAAKLPWDKKVNTWLGDFDMYAGSEYSNKEYYKECLEEIKKFKNTFIVDRISLYTFLHLNPSNRCAYINNEKLLEIVKSSKLEEEFPECFILVLARYHEAVIRKSLLEPAKKSWLELTNIVLPDPCMQCIFSFLSNTDIFDMIER